MISLLDYFPSKTKDGKITISIDFTRWLKLNGSTLSTCTWTSNPSDLTLASASVSSNVASVTVSGGSIGDTYLITAKATAADGSITERTGLMRVVEYKNVTADDRARLYA